MEENKSKGMPLFTKISIVINTLLFGITGIIYLTKGNNIIGYVLLAAGFTNVLYSLVTLKTKNLFFAILNFLFAAVSLIVCFDYFTSNNTNTGMLWMVITIIYLIIGFVLLLQIRKKKPNSMVTQ
ncbi:MAG: hypothetical protein K8S16_14185 [Bacteroidales bacterium]|nr:hypothetical protein [Bacteroidales bacterium]